MSEAQDRMILNELRKINEQLELVVRAVLIMAENQPSILDRPE